ncbi:MULTISPECIES: hydrolase 1, exosortase A system-associated [Halorhodospira]|uniref:hydrolase 1, exosortase A system-associated n=1 Tax=Halorhodospira TaxID=85108 RepID=UPI001911CCF8|nr:hydrolase 1, exosortase A system-associated [Halorhodospira halophila]MCG5537288.1 hydrolase 1, exosortase A system-associated [Halorhodospira sp. 9622]MCG5540148.1 hydrolase 1, exosortase A system-associated [Halorhodospira sp. M39old]MCG5545151.1 hydrolase 1, exosortase A system-associated [Halorhodospira sp. M38]
MDERAVVFQVHGQSLLGICHRAEGRRGVLMVVGGPQYRVGSHRQFVLLARGLAAQGVPVFRFDYRGMGDAEGESPGFEAVEADIRIAVDRFQHQVPQLEEVVLWGLCDAASAGLLYAWQDPRVVGLVLLNPWVRTEAGLARAYLRHYYLRRLASPGFWKDLGQRRVKPLRAFSGLLRTLVAGSRTGRHEPAEGLDAAKLPLPVRMADGWRRFRGPVLLILSGNDLTAAEFRDVVATTRAWRGLLRQDRVEVRELREANHTFSRGVWRDQVARWTGDWVAALPARERAA